MSDNQGFRVVSDLLTMKSRVALFWAAAGALAPLVALAMAYAAATLLLLEATRPRAARALSLIHI